VAKLSKCLPTLRAEAQVSWLSLDVEIIGDCFKVLTSRFHAFKSQS
jgi:hypothetical protein